MSYIIRVEPISQRAKRYLNNYMQNDPNVDVLEGDKETDRILCQSSNQRYQFWLTKSNSTDWKVTG